MSLPPDVSLAWKVWLGSIVSVVAATVAVALRLFARRISAAPFWWDDWTIVASLVSMSIRVNWHVYRKPDLYLGSTMGRVHNPMAYCSGL